MENGLEPVHHIGVTVDDMDRALEFWRGFLGLEPASRAIADAEFLGTLIGSPGSALEIAWIDLPGRVRLELLRYVEGADEAVPEGIKHPGAVHFCLEVGDLAASLKRALDAGATQTSLEPVVVPGGPNQGVRLVYLRDPAGVSIELRQPAPSAAS
jgi:catechol 2,3-dioxygenase-like lactoylglutathione lyase family enzyme